MPPEITTVVRVPLSEIADSIRSRHTIAHPLQDARVEADSLVLTFAVGSLTDQPRGATEAALPNAKRAAKAQPQRDRPRRKAKRTRMKTRGWRVVARIVNSRGQRAAVYEPFVAALTPGNLTAAQRRAVVAKILRENGNSPTEASVAYYLENTLEYLRQNKKEA